VKGKKVKKGFRMGNIVERRRRERKLRYRCEGE